jgi:hypothetical protein
MFSKLIIRIFLWTLVFGLVLFFVWIKVAPSGQMIFTRDFSQTSVFPGGRGFIGNLTPVERVATTTFAGRIYPKIIGEPAYFSWFAPRGFDKLKVTLEYADSGSKPLSLSLGLLMDKSSWNYQLKSLAQPALDDLLKSWSVLREGDVLLLQRQKNYQSVAQFLKQPPVPGRTALFNYNLTPGWKPAKPSGPDFAAPVKLRGAYQFYSYVEKGSMDLDFSFTDLNLNRDPDPITITVIDRSGQVVASAPLSDDGIATDSGKRLPPLGVNIKIPDLPTGIYKTEVKANDDILTESLSGLPYYTVFINRLWAAADPAKPLALKPFQIWTDSQQLRVQTTNPGAVQNYIFAGQPYDLKEAYTQERASASSSAWSLAAFAKDDVLLEGEGVIAFSRDSAFNPDYKSLTSYTDISGLDYVLARYTPPQCADNICSATAEFDLKNAYRENSSYSLMLSIPELDGTGANGLIIKSLRLEATGQTLEEKIKTRFGL